MMELHIVSWILVMWLLSAAWIGRPVYALWAIAVILLWWVAWYNRNPPWPSRARRPLVFIFFFLSVFPFAVFISSWQAWLVLLVILALWLLEILVQRREA
jgi:hypothetical protein